MLPFIGYDTGDYFAHWIDVGKTHDAQQLPRIFYVNWFRRGKDGRFLWPGFGENSRVLTWAIGRIEGTAAAAATAVGHVPAPGSLDVEGLDVSDHDLVEALHVDPDEWRDEVSQIREWFEKLGETVPATLWTELDALAARLGP